ncbi:Zn-dependent hydrolase [Hutsoniella sourekii]|uniref:Zn-dependent hydrolase n=1 Tax=Hutsoniella sourekii TaxID=87650 RepID=UPI00048515C2|nr:Zn-dependent hydrolase [Hutsoniella sourekii]
MYEQSASNVIKDLRELQALTADQDGAHRVAWGPVWQKARDWYRQKAEEIGASLEIDSAGNVWTKLQGEDPSLPALVLGSHLDSVPNGGWLDGALGVLVGLEALRRIAQSGKKPKRTIYVVDFADEEAARYGHSCLGSTAVAGKFELEGMLGRVDHDGVKFEDALAAYGVDVYKMNDAHQEMLERNLGEYVEMHIEQGPVLEQTGKAISCVYGACGVERHEIIFTGQADHAGSTPTELRRDAFLAAAESAIAFREIARKYDAVCTVGEVSVEPDVVTIVPGKCRITLDQRTIDPKDLQAMYEQAQAESKKAAEANGCTVEWKEIYTVAPQLFDDELIELCKEAVEDETGEPTNMYSGPLHDAVEMAKVVPTVMMFVMSIEGISHAKEEDTPEDKIAVGVKAYQRLVDKLLAR